MAIHMGHFFELAVRCQGRSIGEVADLLGITKNILYEKFENPNIDKNLLLEISEKLNINLESIEEKLNKTNKCKDLDIMYLVNFDDLEISIFYKNLLEEYRILLVTLLKLCSEPIPEDMIDEIHKFILIINQYT